MAVALSGTRRFLRTQLWVWPLFAAAILLFVGLWVRGRLEKASEAQISSALTTILEANVEALRNWAATMRSQAEILAMDETIRPPLEHLLQQLSADGSAKINLHNSPEALSLHSRLALRSRQHGFTDYALLSTNMVFVACTAEPLVGLNAPPLLGQHLKPCLDGQSILTHPFASLMPQPDEQGNLRIGALSMFVAAPVKSSAGGIIAILGLRIQPEKDFTRILATARAGKSGETYAFDRNGVMLSQSRFDDLLRQRGVLAAADPSSILKLEVRDPGSDFGAGKPLAMKWHDLPFTRAVSEAIAGRSGANPRGYSGYRGTPVVGAWTWLPDFDFGLVTEVEAADAFATRQIIRTVFWFLFALLTIGSATVFGLMRLADHWQTTAQAATLKARQLGQYALDAPIGSGGFGTVYHAHHALMRRPVAVKVLDPRADERCIARFEREVQITCGLTHPNTIAIYDYGRTPDGQFYYAMEFLDGLTIDALIKTYGPQPEGRVVHLIRQVCASLSEAHAQGLIHRDIKPQNIFLTRRGGVPDFVKVLDFGIVKARNEPDQVELTAAHSILGSPLYMSPEAIQSPGSVDARSDLYAVGAVAYQLLTGEPVFPGATVSEVLFHQVWQEPEKPSVRLKRPLAADLEQIVMQCLAKKPAERFPSAAALEEALGRCSASSTWNRKQADDWWSRNSPAQTPTLAPSRTAPAGEVTAPLFPQ